jgi:hypothetical protein
MRKLILFASFLVCSFAATSATSQTPTPADAARATRAKQLSDYRRHLAKELEKVDAELKDLQPADVRAKSKEAAKDDPFKGITRRAQHAYQREHGFPLKEYGAKAPNPIPDPCEPQRLFIRADSLDNYLYAAVPTDKAKGASVNYTDNQLTDRRSATIQGMVSYVVLRDLCPDTPPDLAPFLSGYAIAPYVFAKGNLTAPRLASERSTLKFGVEAQWERSLGRPLRQVFTMSPYYQTDFRGIARAEGLNLYWDPVDLDWHLGGYIDTNPHLGWYWQFRAEADLRNVSNPGLTSLLLGRYAWGGAIAQLHLFLFPEATYVPSWLRNRVSFTGTAKYFYDFLSKTDVQLYSAELRYKLAEGGSSSISLKYERGTDKDTMSRVNQYVVLLNYAY